MVGTISRSWGGRSVDILFVDIKEPQLWTTKRSRLWFGEKSRIVAGPQLCIQRFVSLLLTRRGTAINPELGSDFLEAAMTGRIRTESSLRDYFALSVSQTIGQVNSQAVRADERMASAVLEDAEVERQRISMRIRLTTEAGDSVTFLAPLERPV